MSNDYDTIIVGGGLLGAALACGIAAKGGRVAVLDGADRDFRASRGNFGLIWVQGKGADFAPYARLSGMAARLWPGFARELQETTGIDVGLQQTGGYDFCLNQEDWDERAREMRQVQAHTGGEFEYQMLDISELRERIPQVSNQVLGASFSPRDGHVNPLYLLRALHQRMQNLGGFYFADKPVLSTSAKADHFVIKTRLQNYRCERVVLCAGLANQRLALELGMRIPVQPLRGQLLITDRVPRFLPCATLQVRQTAEGTLQIGDSHEDVGLDESTTLDVITRLAKRAVHIFPHLSDVRLNRAWGALRIMTPDGIPIYHRSPDYAGAYAVSCHSGVTLAAYHATELANWICDQRAEDLISEFSATRFDV
ncbi:MAG: FAD-binding oxidoreductase [Gammaproteobacteria bacterium]|nr:FAD-binding oxidoreductase [Gammaproteobacteria bacterium]MCP4984074.1 FAD-binding oxidoreductase [Gammaproteobacteria bacterium]